MVKKVSRILVFASGSPFDEEVVSLACDIGHDAKASVWVLYVLQVPRTLPLDAEVPAEAARGEMVLQQMEQLGKSRKCKLEGGILQARDVGPAVVDEAVARNVDLIVAGASYQEHYGSPTLGGVVPYLLKHSPCRVLVYRASQGSAPVGANA